VSIATVDTADDLHLYCPLRFAVLHYGIGETPGAVRSIGR
jgi:hypothetical protein